MAKKNINKTRLTNASVANFLNKIENQQKRADCFRVVEIMKDLTQAEPKMWGTSIVGFGDYHYKYESGREGDWFLTGFSPRKTSLTLYFMGGFDDSLMEKLGKYKTGKSCLYIKKLSDIDEKVLKQLLVNSIEKVGRIYGNRSEL